ncbi:sensor histidine kinase, partial [Pseudomonas syringae pv. pisi str. 1704B]
GTRSSADSTNNGSAERLATLETAADPLATGPQWLERP